MRLPVRVGARHSTHRHGPLGTVHGAHPHRAHPHRARAHRPDPYAPHALAWSEVSGWRSGPHELDYDQLFGDLQVWEGFVPFMYLDNAVPPRVTVGVGNMLPDIATAQTLPFVNTTTGQAATPDEVAAAYNKVTAMPGALSWKKYKQSPSIELDPTKSRDLALARLRNEFIPELRQAFPHFDVYPFPAQRALIDMAYNMGVGRPARVSHGVHHSAKGLYKFDALRKAAEAGDWLAASQHCQRANKKNNPHTARRNAWTQWQFEIADRVTAHRELP